MQEISLSQITIDKISYPFADPGQIELAVLRLDKIHPLISGNKWFKLQYYLNEAMAQKKDTILTFGGAWSNHIIAVAAACHLKGIRSIGIIRGEAPGMLSATLQEAMALGMQLFFISRSDYAIKKIPPELSNADFYLVSEGGYGQPGAAGAAKITDHVTPGYYTHICCAVGTGTMMAGLLNASDEQQSVIGIPVMKNNTDLDPAIRQLLENKTKPFLLLHDYHFGGYAKYTPALLHFMNDFYQHTSIPSDFVYTGKLFYAVADLMKKEFFPKGSRILVIHSGGLRGNASLRKGTLIF